MNITKGTLTMRAPDDFHGHLREGALLLMLAPLVARVFKRMLVMPNREEAILSGGQAVRYYLQIKNLLEAEDLNDFEPLMTIQVTEQTTPEMILDAAANNVTAGKVYPRGMTTNSENGVLDYRKIYPALEAMQDCGMVASFHGESPDPTVDPIDREWAFARKILPLIAKKFPKLKIVMEHVTDGRTLKVVNDFENVAATVTVHHLLITMTDWHGKKLKPHLFCKPEAKRFRDRDALREFVFSGNPKAIFGTDMAPHPRSQKECDECSAGVFMPPDIALPILVELFEQHHALQRLEPFVSENGAKRYGLPLNQGTVTLEKKEWDIPGEYFGVIPFMAGKTLRWQFVGRV